MLIQLFFVLQIIVLMSGIIFNLGASNIKKRLFSGSQSLSRSIQNLFVF